MDHVILLMCIEVSEDKEEREKKILLNLLLQQNINVTKRLKVHRECTPDKDILGKIHSLNYLPVKPRYLHSYLILV